MKIKRIIMLGLVIALIIPIINAETIWDESSARINLATGYFCPSPYSDWIDTNKDPFEYFSTTAPPLFDCRDPYGGPSCCPLYSKCQSIGDVQTNPLPDSTLQGYSCFVSLELHCSQFKTQSECEEGANIPLAIASIENNPDYGKGYCFKILNSWKVSGGTCWNETFCECIWNSTDCLAEQRVEKNCTTNGGYQIQEECDYQISYDDSLCNEPGGYILATYNLIIGPAECKPTNTYQLPCTEIMRLTFFSWINAIAVIVILVVIYYLYVNSKKKKKKKKR